MSLLAADGRECFSGPPNQEDPMPRRNCADLCMDPSPMDTRPMFCVKAASTKGVRAVVRPAGWGRLVVSKHKHPLESWCPQEMAQALLGPCAPSSLWLCAFLPPQENILLENGEALCRVTRMGREMFLVRTALWGWLQLSEMGWHL